MEVFLVEGVNFFREVRPTQGSCELFPELGLIFARTFLRQLDLPATKIIQQPHVRLDQDRQPP
jgi:hypothetical protein